jgi:hypothetical protein
MSLLEGKVAVVYGAGGAIGGAVVANLTCGRRRRRESHPRFVDGLRIDT